MNTYVQYTLISSILFQFLKKLLVERMAKMKKIHNNK